jgi:hypothetical protein
VIKEQDRERAQDEKAKKALRAFHPKKSERRSYVFIRTDGKRVERNAKRPPVGFLVYVNGRGAKRLHKQTDGLRGKIVGRAKKLSSYRLDQLPYARARRNFLEQGTRLFTKGSLRGKPLSLGPTCKLWSSITKALRHPGTSASMLVEVMLRGYSNGELVTATASARIMKPRSLSPATIRAWLRSALYSAMARSMREKGIVGRGSSDHIKHLRENRGKRREQWTTGGLAWSGRNSDLVDWRQADWRVHHIYYSSIGNK